jgi:very-short-patch-repair endonuclease
LPATTLKHTFADLSRRLSRVELLVLADEALRLKLGRFDEFAEPAESPMETRLRWLLIQAGLPRPEVQVKLSFGRADLYYRSARLVIEYDGDNHRDRLVEDNRRQNALINAGFRVLRYTASDVFQRPGFIVTQVRQALVSGTAPPAAAKSA